MSDAAKLRAVRERIGWSVLAVHRLTGISEGTLRRMECGQARMPEGLVGRLERIARAVERETAAAGWDPAALRPGRMERAA